MTSASDSRIRVHILASRADRSGGADIYTSELVQRLSSDRFDVSLICFNADESVAKFAQLVRVDRQRFDEWPLAWRLSPLLQLISIRESLAKKDLQAPDVVLGMAHQLIWAHRQVFGRLPLVYLPHSLVAPLEVASYGWRSSVQRACAVTLWTRLERRYLREAYRTVRFTHQSARMLHAHYGGDVGGAFEVIPTAVPVPDQTPTKPESGTVRLLSVGRLVDSKNVGFVLAVLADLREFSWHLDVLGEGSEWPALENLAARLSIVDRVRFHGHCDPVPFYKRAHLLLTASRIENAPLVILEAMSFGVPTLAIKRDDRKYLNAHEELITDRHDGFLADHEEHFQRLLVSILQDPTALGRAGAAAADTVRRRHTWSSHVRVLEGVLAGAAGEVPRVACSEVMQRAQ